MKTTVKHLAAGTFIALILLVGNVQAEGTETKTSNQAIETTLQIEKWMTDETLWNTNSKVITGISAEKESAMEIEDWMTSTETWDFNKSIAQETEAGMVIESWMTSEENWKSINKVNEAELELTVEN